MPRRHAVAIWSLAFIVIFLGSVATGVVIG